MKKITILIISTIMALTLCACEENGNATVNDSSEAITDNEVTSITEEKAETEPEGIQADGKGQVIPLSKEEKAYVLEQTTESWLEMDKDTKDALVVLIGRWWEDCENIIVEDYDDMVKVIDHQMEQYYRNNVNESLFDTVCDIYDRDKSLYTITENVPREVNPIV